MLIHKNNELVGEAEIRESPVWEVGRNF